MMAMYQLCRAKAAKHPCYIESIDINIYTIEELCFYLWKNVSLLDESILNEKLCDWLEKHTDLAEKDYRKSGKCMDEKREEYTRAEEVLKWFIQLEDAEQKLQECADDESKIVETTALISRIRNAYEIRETGDLLNDAERRLAELEQSLKTQEKQLPILEETRKTAEKAEEQKKLIRDQELQSYSKIAEKESIDFLSASDAAQPSEIDREHLSEQGHKELARNILKWFDI